MTSTDRPIGIYYEHPEWFRPLFAELDRRGLPYVPLDASRHRYDATNGDGREFGLVFNRMSPSAYLRGARPQHPLHAELPGAPRASRRAGGERARRVPRRDLEGAATVAAEVARPAVPAGAGHQPSRRGARRRRRAALPGGGQGQHRRQRRRHRALRPSRGPGPRRRRGPRRSRARPDGAGAGVHPGAGRHDHPGRGPRRPVSLRDRGRDRDALQPVPGRHLPGRARRAGRRRLARWRRRSRA